MIQDVGFLPREKIINDEGEMVGGEDLYGDHFTKYNYITTNSWGDDQTLQIFQYVFNIKIIILDMQS